MRLNAWLKTSLITLKNWVAPIVFSHALLVAPMFLFAACSSGLNKEPSAAVRSTIVGTGPVVADGISTSTITITLLDGDGAALQGVVPTFDATDTDQGNTYGACSTSNTQGISTCSLKSIRKETKTLRILTPILKTGSTVVFTPGPIDHFTVTTQPSTSAVAGVALAQGPVFEARDETDNIVTTTSANVTLAAFSDSLCTVPKTGTLSATANPTTPSAGVVTFSNVSFTKTGTLYLRASSTGATSACTQAINITHASAHHLGFSTAPSSSATAGVTLPTSPIIEVQDQYNNRVSTGSDASSTITMAAFSNAACTSASTTSLSATQNPLNASSGLAAFTSVSTTLAQTTYLKFSATGLTAICSSAIAVSPNTPNTGTSTITGSGPIAANGFHSSAITVTIKDVYSNPISGTTPTFSATNTGSTNIYGACGVSNASGVSSCTLKSSQDEVKTLTLNSPVTVIGGTVTFIKPPDSSLSTFTATTPVTADGISTSNLSIQLLDSTSAPVVGLTPVVASTGTGNTISACTVTNGSGNSTCTIKSTKAEVKTLSLTNPLSRSGPSVTFVHGTAAKLSFSVQPSTTAVAGANLATSPQVEVQDASGNRITTGGSASATITLEPFTNNTCTSPGTGTLSASTHPLNASSGVAAFSSVNYSLSGVFYIKASSPGLTSICSSAVTITPAAYSLAQSSFTVSANSVTSGASITATLIAKDAYGNSLPTGLPAIGSIQFFSSLVGGTGNYGAITNPTAGTYQATFTGQIAGSVTLSAKVSGSSVAQTQSITVNPGAAASIVFTTQPSNSNTAGAPFSTPPQVSVLDANNNVLTGLSTGTVTLSVSTGSIFSGATASISSGVADFSSLVIRQAGTGRTLTASYSSFTSTASNTFAIVPAAASKLLFTTQPSSTAQKGRIWTAQPVVEVTDDYSNRITSGADATTTVTLSAATNASCSTPSGSNLSAAQNPLNATSGLATFTGTSYPDAETIYVHAEAPGLNSACSNAVLVLHWRTLSTTGAPAARSSPKATWVGSKLFVWGGKDGGGTALSSGGLYDSTTDTWSTTSNTGAVPSARFNHAQIWTGSEVFVWGGDNGTQALGDGSLFNPSSNTWTAISNTNAPSARTGFASVWTGSAILVFGGNNGSTHYDDLYQYDPASNQWQLISTGLLSARTDVVNTFDSASGLWFLFGGKDAGGSLNTGVIYNAATTASSSVAAEINLGDVLKHDSFAIFQNQQFWVYGQSGSSAYHATHLTWTNPVTTNEPSHTRSNIMGTFSNNGLFIFGGYSGGASLASGAIWNSTTETWNTLPTESTSPSARASGSAVWSGSEVLIWGGCSDGPTCTSVSNSGWSFTP